VDGTVIQDIQTTLTALADPGRRRAVELLGQRPMRIAELAEQAGTSRPVTARQLRELLERGLVEPVGEAGERAAAYRLRADQFVALQSWLTELWTYWKGQIDRAA
jgi:DNA-binding transcriptional regulator GbsR (MarR family)